MLNTDNFKYYNSIESLLAKQFGLESLRCGNQVIRDHRGWRDNEKRIDHIWIAHINRSHKGWGGVFAVKFSEYKFRNLNNPAELIRGAFKTGGNGVVDLQIENAGVQNDPMVKLFGLNLFEANRGITLDGVSYAIRIIAPNTDTFIYANNPNEESWTNLTREVWSLGISLSSKSDRKELVEFFK